MTIVLKESTAGESPKPASPGRDVRRHIWVGAMILSGLVFSPLVMWLSGRFIGEYLIVRGLWVGFCIGLPMIAVFIFPTVLPSWRRVREKAMVWHLVIFIALLVHLKMDDLTLRAFMSGFENAMASAGMAAWEKLPEQVPGTDLRGQGGAGNFLIGPGDGAAGPVWLSKIKLPLFARNVYRWSEPACFGLTGEILESKLRNVLIRWGDEWFYFGIRYDGPVLPGDTRQIRAFYQATFERRISSNAWLVAYEFVFPGFQRDR